ncbi:hypothetical protein CTAYLR_009284 [Chrysophaeum taylorii]|uniref:Thioredoxin domain-containing protein n=1 Tax=Chrysophaeum taylorii TaxID=2483200 RepID=A0AAD7UJJ0_9STRA|nr:hypothetical protein CTAYLR_009284 [Chrysophaeum taylorii]
MLFTLSSSIIIIAGGFAQNLSTDCYGFPARSFSRSNCVKCRYGSSPHIPVEVGNRVPEFALDGTSLASLLDKPVVLIWGMWTCPAFQGLGGSPPFDQCSYMDEYGLVDKYVDRANFVHLMGPEPHPVTPDVNFDSGRMLMNYWSTVPQPRTWADRATLASRVAPMLHPKARFLVDTLGDNPKDPRNSPVWCSLGQGARTALLVDTQGYLRYAQEWFHAGDMADQIDQFYRSSER